MLLDFTKKREIDLSFKAENGKTFTKKGTISAYIIDVITENTNNLMTVIDEIKTSGEDITIKTGRIAEAEKETNRKVLETVMGDDYDKYLELVEGYENYAEEVLIARILASVDEVREDVLGETNKPEGK